MNIVESTIQELAANIPGASELFDSYQINYHSEAAIILKDLVWDDKNHLADIVEKIKTLKKESPSPALNPWRQVSANELISHILENFHEKHRMQLSDAIRQTQLVADAHGNHSDFPRQLEAHLASMQFELEEHMMKEEEILFPMIARGMYPSGPIYVMESEHTDHAKALEFLREITHDFSPPRDACDTWKTLYYNLQELYFDLKEHIHLENDILFQQQS